MSIHARAARETTPLGLDPVRFAAASFRGHSPPAPRREKTVLFKHEYIRAS